MPVDITMVRAALNVLKRNQGRPDMTEELVAIDLETALRRPLPMHQVRAALVECRGKGWAKDSADEWGEPIWKITDAGMNRLQPGGST